MPFLDALTDQVNTAGRQTSATSTRWRTWAVQAEEALRTGPTGADNAIVSGAGEVYVGDWSARLHSVGDRVDQLGTNTSAGAAVVDDTDTEAAGFLNTFGQEAAGRRGNLSRLI